MNDFKTPPKTFGRTALIAGLRRELGIVFGQFGEQATFGDGMSQRFFAVDMFARRERRLADGNMPMIGRADDDGIYARFLIEQLAIIVIRFGLRQAFDL